MSHGRHRNEESFSTLQMHFLFRKSTDQQSSTKLFSSILSVKVRACENGPMFKAMSHVHCCTSHAPAWMIG